MNSASTRYTSFAVILEDGDKDSIDDFFETHNRKRARFFRDAIIEKIEREEQIEREREAIRAGRSQVDPMLLEQRR
jgi:predicted transcriptional regulator